MIIMNFDLSFEFRCMFQYERTGLIVKKRTVVSSVVFGALATFLGGTLYSTAAHAADTEVRFGYESESNIPVNPAEPSEDLTLLYVPRAFDFGNQNDVNDSSFTAVNDTGKFYLALKDNREIIDEGKGNSWQLVGSFSSLVNESSGDTINANLSFDATDVKDYNGKSDPATNGALGEASVAVEGKSVILVAGGAGETILESVTGENGQWAANVVNVTLNVPTAGEAGTQYAGTVTWTLSDAV